VSARPWGNGRDKADEMAQIAMETHSAALVAVNLADDLGREDTPQRWVWAGYVPAGHVTLLAGHGGAGKSWLALLLAVCVAMGVPFLGQQVERMRVIFYSAEDAASLVLKRLRVMCRLLGVRHDDLAEWLTVIDATAADALFAETWLDGTRRGTATPTYHELAELVRRDGSVLLIVDNGADVFDGDEINRRQVRAFMRKLAALVHDTSGAVMLLAHVDKLSARGGKLAGSESYSGSTAWHNAARSRLFLVELEPGSLELRHEKCNVGARRPALRLQWPADGLIEVENGGGMVAVIEERNDTKALLQLVHEFTERGERVSTATSGRGAAPAAFAKESGFPKGLKPADVFDLLRRAERQKFIERDTYRGTDRKPREAWKLTNAGLDYIGAANAANAANPGNAALAHSAQEPAANAANPPRGVRGVERAHKWSAQTPQPPPRATSGTPPPTTS
jgi:putative DNA primase/helicase